MEFFRRRLALQAVDDDAAPDSAAWSSEDLPAEGARRASVQATARRGARLALAPRRERARAPRRRPARTDHRIAGAGPLRDDRYRATSTPTSNPRRTRARSSAKRSGPDPRTFGTSSTSPPQSAEAVTILAAVDGFASTFFACRLDENASFVVECSGGENDRRSTAMSRASSTGKTKTLAARRARPRHVYRPSEVIVHLIHDQVFDGTGAGRRRRSTAITVPPRDARTALRRPRI